MYADTDHGEARALPPERPRYQLRRTSALPYQHPGSRDTRGPKNLVVVIPPPDFPLDQGQLGNVLSMGPRHRLSQGILMPLFPSMFGQLNAIAREYNFPSTVGLCLYLHVNESGSTMTPRISDDAWQYLFGHLFEGRPPTTGLQMPIGASIEFDIDLNKARWFDAWLSGTMRDSDPALPQVPPSRPSLDAHWRGESRTTHADEQPAEERWDASGSQTLISHSRPETLRHLPRKLSLVDRLELQGVHVPPKLHQSDALSPTHALSPIPQSAVPRTSKSELERRVNSWRATTELYPDSMTEAYRPVPNAAAPGGVTTMDEYALECNFSQGTKIDEYLWSVTSPGPRSPVKVSPIPSSRLSSVHLDRRANGTLPLTPMTMTSWGPVDDDWYSIASNISRLPSPDIGERGVFDIMAPKRSAVWGNSFGWRFAVTWKAVYPYSAARTKPTIRVQLQEPNGVMPQYPNLVIYPAVSPTKYTFQSVWGSSFGWQINSTWRNVYPYSTVSMPPVAPTQFRGEGGLMSKYPSICIYPAIYPYFDIYPPWTVKEDISKPVSVALEGANNIASRYPSLVIYPAAYPHFDIYPPITEGAKMEDVNSVDTSLTALYPNFIVYPAVYPHFDLYPPTMQVVEPLKRKVVDARLPNAGRLVAEYPNMIIYPSAYPYLNIYPTRETRKDVSSIVWAVSFGWLSAKTWLRVYPLHIVNPLVTRVSDQNMAAATATVGKKQAIWGSSFGWKSATTWRAVWPIPNASAISVYLKQQDALPSSYPYLVIYPAAYPHFDIYPARAALTEVEELQVTKKDRYSADLVPHYPNVVIYVPVYPHFDVYPAFAKAVIVVEHGKGQSNLRRRRIEMWRARTAAQVGLIDLLANNHTWEVDEPLQLDLADYAWSQTSAGPASPRELPNNTSIPESVHLTRRVQGSVLLTASTATTWGPQDNDWCSEIASIERLPTPDLGLRVLDDVENIEFSDKPWHFVWPFFRDASQVKTLASVPEKTVFVPEYPHLVIYPTAYPCFDIYPTRASAPGSRNLATDTPAQSSPYPVLDIYPVVYPHFNIYPAIDLRLDNPNRAGASALRKGVETRLPALYPDLDIYHACYPYNLNHIYPFIKKIESTPITAEGSCGYPWLVIYFPVYPFIIPYPGFTAEINQPSTLSVFSTGRKLVDVKLPAQYPVLDIYPAGYPGSLESIYPAVSLDHESEVLKAFYPCISIYPAVYPFVEPYPSLSGSALIPGSLDQEAHKLAKAFLALSEGVNLPAAAYPYFDLYPIPSTPTCQERAVPDAYVAELAAPLPPVRSTPARRPRKTHKELHVIVFQCLEKRPARHSKTHQQLHNEVFQDGVVWTPSGYVQDLSFLTTKPREDTPIREPPCRPSQGNPPPRPSRSRSGTLAPHSADKVVSPPRQPPALPPLRVRSPGIPAQPHPAVSETPMPRVSSPTTAYAHMRTTSSRFSQAVRSIVHRRSSSSATTSPPPDEHKEHPKDAPPSPARFLSLVDRRSPGVSPPPHTNTPEFLTRVPRISQTKESSVLQRARAYEQATGEPFGYDSGLSRR